MSNLKAKEYQGFEQIKLTDEEENEYWFVRELVPVLEYSKRIVEIIAMCNFVK